MASVQQLCAPFRHSLRLNKSLVQSLPPAGASAAKYFTTAAFPLLSPREISMAPGLQLHPPFRHSLWLNKSLAQNVSPSCDNVARAFTTAALTLHSPLANPQRPITSVISWKLQEIKQARPFSMTPSILPEDDEPLNQKAMIARMTNEELEDTSTIPGWELVHNPPRRFPRGSLVGVVASTKMQKTVNVTVTRTRIVPKIRKRIKYTRKFMAHDEKEVANLGDTVLIVPSQKISKNKHFMLREIIRAKGQLYEEVPKS